MLRALLNKFTMYKVVLYGLLALLAVAELLALFGVIGISAGGLALSIIILTAVCYGTNWLLARIVQAPFNSESYFITAAILACILPPIDSLSSALLVALTATIAMASKYLLVWRGSHLFNPAALAAFVMSITGLLPATWWIATPYLLPFAAALAILVLSKQRNYQLFLMFAIVAVGMLLLNGTVLQHVAVGRVLKDALFSWPIVFMGSIMLTEPITLPVGRYNQLLVAALVGVLFGAEVHVGVLSTTPQFALLIGNIVALSMLPPFGAMLKLKQHNQLADDVFELVFERPTCLRYTAGQYMEFTLMHPQADIRGYRRTFSLASAPSESELRLAVRTYTPSSSFKKALQALQPGTRLRAFNVAGEFVLPANPHTKLALIAGGIGITPIRSMIAELVAKKQTRDVVLVYVASDKQHHVYKEVFDAAKAVGLQTEYVLGRVGGDELLILVPDMAERTVYISGPDAMVTNYRQSLVAQGVSRRRIHTDHFTGY